MTTTRLIATVWCTLTAAIALPAQGQTVSHEPDEETPRWAPVQVLEFGDDTVEGGVQSPDGALVTAQPRAVHAGLIEIRQDFASELAKTLEDL